MNREALKREAVHIVNRKIAEASAEIVKLATLANLEGELADAVIACLHVQVSAKVGLFIEAPYSNPSVGACYHRLQGYLLTEQEIIEGAVSPE